MKMKKYKNGLVLGKMYPVTLGHLHLIDTAIENATTHLVDKYRDEIAAIISDTVARWDAGDTAKKIELQVGRDLQFIRVNGTIVGALAGIVIHAIGEFVVR